MTQQQLQTSSDAEFLDLLEQRGVELRMQAGKLRISAPPGVIDDELKAELVSRKAMLLAIGQERAAAAPLSYAQERLWLLEQFRPGNFAYNIPESADIRVSLDANLLQRAIQFVTQRHETLRTSLEQDQRGVARQRIHPQIENELQRFDYTHLDRETKEAKLQESLRSFARQPFDLKTAPLVRFYLVRMELERFVLFVVIHHVVADRWSLRILMRDLLEAYNTYAHGKEPALPALPMQYADFARRERAPDTPEMREQLAYWKNKLTALPSPPQLPFRLHTASTQPFDGAIHTFAFTPAESVVLRTLARAGNASLYMVTLAAWVALLHRFTGATDLCVGSPVSSRLTTDTESLIGFFVNTLVMRCSVTSEQSFADLLAGVRETVLDAHTNQDVPLQRLLTELRSDPNAANMPIFETMVSFDSHIAEVAAAESSKVVLDPGLAKFDLTLQMNDDPDCVRGYIEYKTDLFAADAIARFTEAFLLLVRCAAQAPATAVGRLQIVSAADRDRMLRTWNATAMPFPREKAIHQLFEEQVEKTPDDIAVIFGSERLSYRELNRMANRVALGLLAEMQVSVPRTVPGIVAVHMRRSPELIAVLLGILKTGSAYLPLDPQYPEQRILFMLEDSGAAIVLSDSWEGKSNVGRARQLSPVFSERTPADLDRNPAIAVSPDDLAYVIYTSGSTGRPKGVAIEHHSTVSFLTWGRHTFTSEELRGTVASTSISFDLSVFEIFLPLSCGGAIVLMKDVFDLAELDAAVDVTLLTTVPSAVSALLDRKMIPAKLQTINLAGEPLSAQLVDRLYAETSVKSVNDLYGPTETTTYSTWTKRLPQTAPTIGRPLANTRVYLVDASLQMVPMGIPGELLIAGEGVARGYLGRPELTAEKFVSLPHLGEMGTAYRTGDLCSYNQDSTLVYLGRIDQQVKVRGFRVEIGEIENAMRTHPTVDEAVVVVKSDAATGAALVGYVRVVEGRLLDVAGLIAHQSMTLPHYMVVRQITELPDFPRTANGKIDRKAIAAIALSSEEGNAVVAPRDALEKELVAIWQEEFHRSAIGIDDDFFEIGGHSLLALRVFAEIEVRLECRMMLSVLFEAPTIRLLAKHMREQMLS